jgi:hypothetical protein
MILVLQDSVTSETIGEMPDMDFCPAQGETFLYHEDLPDETSYTVVKRLYPTLMRDGVKVIRLRVHLAT